MSITAPPSALGRRRPPIWIAHAAAAAAVACVSTTLAVIARSGSWSDLFVDEPVAGLVFTALGWRLATRLPRNSIGWLLLAGGFGGAAASLANLLVTRGDALGALALRVLAMLGNTLWILPFALLPQVLLAFPHGRLSGRWPKAAAAVTAVGAAGIVACFAAPAILLPAGTSVAAAFEPPWLLVALLLGSAGIFVAGLVATLACVVVRFRSSRGEQRQQMRWLAAAGMLAVGLLATSVAASLGPGAQSDVLWTLTLLVLPIAITIAVSRYRLWDLDRLVSRTLAYALVSGALISVYLGVVTATGAMFGESPLAVASATLTAAAAFGPLRRRVQSVVDRRFDRAQYDAAKLVEAYRSRLRDRVDLDEVLDDLTAAASAAMSPATVSVWLPRSRGTG